MRHNDWTDKLRSRLADREAPVPDDLWNKIEARMDEAKATKDDVPQATQPSPMAPHRPRVVRMVAWAVSAAAAVAVLVTVALRLNDDDIRRVASIERKAAKHNYRTIWPNYDSGLLVAKAAPAAPADGKHKAPCADMPCVTGNDGTTETMHMESNDIDSAEVARCETPHADMGQVPPTAQKQTVSHKKQTAYNRPVYHIDGQDTHARAHGRWHVAVHADGVAIGSQSSQRPMLSVASSDIQCSASTDNAPTADHYGPMSLKAYSPLMAEYQEKKHHARPVSIGLTVDVPLTRGVSVVTGVAYTIAATDFVSSVGNSEAVEKQKLHYIGVPLNLKFNVWSIGGLHTYVSGGAQADFNVAARLTTGDISKDIDKDRPQFSLGAAAGVQYNVVNNLGLYAEPGLKYYIDNGSKVETIFKEKKLNFSLQLGLRYGF